MGADRVVRLLVNLNRRQYGRAKFTMPHINGSPGLLIWFDERIEMALAFETDSASISRIWVVRAPAAARSGRRTPRSTARPKRSADGSRASLSDL